MKTLSSCLLLVTATALTSSGNTCNAFTPTSTSSNHNGVVKVNQNQNHYLGSRLYAESNDDDAKKETESEGTPEPQSSDRYDVSKLVGGSDDGAGFNQFDPVLKATGFMSRRFGIAGGLAIFAALAAIEGSEILKSMDEAVPTLVDASELKVRTTASGLQITDLQIGKGGKSPLPGNIVGFNTKVSIGDKVIFDSSTTEDAKPVAFKLGQRPFQNVICEGVEEGIMGMKVGGKRKLDVPKGLAPPGVTLPDGVPLTYELELTEVLPGYF